MVKVLIVDDSATTRLSLERILSSDPEISIAGSAGDGEEAVAAVQRLRPDVITMDVQMPGMDGLQATRRIMETCPVPIIILSGNLDQEEIRTSFQAMEAGALTALPKPHGPGHPDHEREMAALVRAVKLLSEVKVVKRWSAAGIPGKVDPFNDRNIEIVAIGASTGGPVVIRTILSALGPGFPVPIVIVQHMAAGFIHGFAEWLGNCCGFPVLVPSDGDFMRPGHAYIAPDGLQMTVTGGGKISLDGKHKSGIRPSVSALFRSVADVYGKTAAAVLLSGMGKDGAEEMLLLKKAGAVTIAQDSITSVIYGMPGEAVRLGAATHVMGADEIAPALGRFVRKKKAPKGLTP